MNWRALVLRLMRVPPQPEPPPGSPPRIFRAAPNFLTLRMIHWALSALVLLAAPLIVTVITTTLGASGAPPLAVLGTGALAAVLWIVELVQVFLGWAVLRLDFEMRWYMLSDRAIRIREGIVTVREKTMALANVQNIEIKQGPLQRFLGIADVEVKTAGGGGGRRGPHGKGESSTDPMHVAFFRGVDNAEVIRDLVRDAVRRQRNSGLGDHDEARQAPAGADSRAAAAELLQEARALRAVLGR